MTSVCKSGGEEAIWLARLVVVHEPSPFLPVHLSLLCRDVSTKEGEMKAEHLKAMFIETSAHNGLNIEHVSVSTYMYRK